MSSTSAILLAAVGTAELGNASGTVTSRHTRCVRNASSVAGSLKHRRFTTSVHSRRAALMTRPTSWRCANPATLASPLRWVTAGTKASRGRPKIASTSGGVVSLPTKWFGLMCLTPRCTELNIQTVVNPILPFKQSKEATGYRRRLF